MPGRGIVGATGYRYGFNGQEKDDEVSGNGNSNTAEFWQYDTRLGRRWNVDPVVESDKSGYSCFYNNPIENSDVKGDNPEDPTKKTGIGGGLKFTMTFGGGSSIGGYFGGYQRNGGVTSGLNFSATLFRGGPGTSKASPFLFNLAMSPTLTFGTGVGVGSKLNVLYQGAGTAVVNNFNYSFTSGWSFIYSSGGRTESGIRSQNIGYLGFRVGAFSAGHANDVRNKAFPFTDGHDQFHSAVINAGLDFNNGMSVSYWSQMYYGKSNSDATFSDDVCDANGQNYDDQSPYNMMLNNAQETLNFTIPASMTDTGFPVTFGAGRIGAGAMWPSNMMHNSMKYLDRKTGKKHSFHHLLVPYQTKPVLRFEIN